MNDADSSPKRIAVLGSSGGNLRSHGGNDPEQLVADVRRQLEAAGFVLEDAQFVTATTSMDGVSQDTPAKLWTLRDGEFSVTTQGSLSEVNQAARTYDAGLATRVGNGEIDGLILISADPQDTNSETIAAAIAQNLPAGGTGGTSIATAQQLGLRLVSTSGTTGTTSVTRAVSYVSGLARHWKVKYRPSLGGSSTSSGPGTDESVWQRFSIRGIMVGSIPAFIALALVLAISKIPGMDFLSDVFDTLIDGLPIVVAAIAARKISGLDEVGIVAGAVAGVLSVKGGILGGLAGGILAGILAGYLIKWTLAKRFPATTANIVTGAIAGVVPGLLVYYALAPATVALGDAIKVAIEWTLDFNPLLAGALAGIVIWPAIIGGVYHSVILPLVLIEMSDKGHSFFGAIDMVSLVMVSLGITLANVIKSRTTGERALAGTGAAVNFFFGTFVESSYPFMFGDKKVFGIALLSATAGGTVVGLTGAQASAYLPAVVSPFISTTALGMIASMVTALGLAFVLTFAVNMAYLRKAKHAELLAA